mgnify:FL=1
MTALPLRRLTEDGIEEFRRWLEEQSSAENTRPPYGLLDAPGTSLPVDGAVDVERRVFEHKRAMTRYLEEIITRSEIVHPADDIGLWSWLALHWIESLCPVNQNGRRKPKKTYHYVFDPDHRRRYRHLIAAPYEIHRAMPEWNQLFLLKPVDVHGDLMEQAMGRLYLIRIPAVSEAIERLYFDTENQKAKPGMLRDVKSVV